MDILVVDDFRATTKLIQEALSAKHNTVVAHSGEEAMEFIWERKFDMVISDIVMPGMSGLELFVEARKIAPALKFVFITGTKEPSVRGQAIRLGPVGYLEKPFKISELRAVVEKMAAERRRGFSGHVESLDLPSIISLCCVQGTNVRVSVTSAGRKGELYIRKGRVVHAACGRQRGKKALLNIISWEEGKFTMKRDHEEVEHTVEEGLEAILLEHAIRSDESDESEVRA